MLMVTALSTQYLKYYFSEVVFSNCFLYLLLLPAFHITEEINLKEKKPAFVVAESTCLH